MSGVHCNSALYRLRELPSFLSYNVKLLPWPFNEGDDGSRAERIAAAIRAYDVVCLQEVFRESMRNILVSALKRDGYEVRPRFGGSFFKQDSGLVVASRAPIAETGWTKFGARGPVTKGDFWSHKGVVAVRLDFDGKVLTVVNTHLMSDPEEVGEFRSVRERQLQDVLRLARDTARGGPVLHAGDFNIAAPGGLIDASVPAFDGEYRPMLTALGARDLLAEEPGYTWNGLKNPIIPEDDRDLLRLDYLLASGDLDAQPTAVLDWPHSDHWPIATEFSV